MRSGFAIFLILLIGFLPTPAMPPANAQAGRVILRAIQPAPRIEPVYGQSQLRLQPQAHLQSQVRVQPQELPGVTLPIQREEIGIRGPPPAVRVVVPSQEAQPAETPVCNSNQNLQMLDRGLL